MEPVELTLARYRTADLVRDAQVSRVAHEARAARPSTRPAARAAVSALAASSVRLERAAVAPLVALAHRLAPRTTSVGEVCCA